LPSDGGSRISTAGFLDPLEGPQAYGRPGEQLRSYA